MQGIHAELVKVRVARKGIENTRCSFLKDALRGPTALVHADTDERYAHKAFNDIVKVSLLVYWNMCSPD